MLDARQLPSNWQSGLHLASSTVISYRVLLACLFGEDIEKLPDLSYREDVISGEMEEIPLKDARIK